MQELKQMKIWHLWIWGKGRNGKPTKVPISAHGGETGTDKDHSSTWVTYDEAIAAVQKRHAAGVGFVIPEGYFFLDIDHMELTDPFVQTILNRYNSYTEYSQSGNGVHAYGKIDISKIPTYTDDKGKLRLNKQFYMKNPHNATELYFGGITNRFACFTGNAILDIPLKDCTQAVLTTLDKDMRKKKKKKYSAKRDGDADAAYIIAELREQRNGEKFEMLFDRGDISEYGNDDSAANCALCALIAFRTGDNPELIDAIFRQSALMRDKWEREDYREMTIDAALEACGGEFHFSLNPKPDFVAYIPEKDMEVVICTKLAKHIRENLHYIFVRDNGRQGVLRYVYENGCYRYYSDDMLRGVIKRFIADYNEDLIRMSIIGETFGLLTTDLNFVTHDEINADENIINFQNGILRLSDMALLPHTPEILSTIQIPCEWTGKNVSTPVFDSYIHTLTNGDKAVEQLLLEFGGACISNVMGSRMKKALFLVGKGDTGKSQLKSLVEQLIGRDNFISIDLSEMEARFGSSNIYGKRLAGSSDMSFMTVGELKAFKQCTGGDSIFAEFKGMNGFEFRYRGLLWFCMNRLPKFGGDDGQWVYDRIMQVECNNVIPKEKQDKMLLDKMYAEREGIVYKFVRALKTVIANGYRFSEPDSVSQARQQYMEDNNTVIAFYHECMMERPQGKITDQCTTGRVFNVYKAWCADNNHGFAKTAKEFRTILAEYLDTDFPAMTVRRGKGGTFYRTLTLTPETKEVYERVYGYEDSTFLSA
jgi:putative DNA primase/helicase|nr:MAG TPA: dsDNA helicase [Caudoviricetes sp.]